MPKIEIQATQLDAGKRLDAFVAEACECSRSQAVGLIAEGGVFVDGSARPKSYHLVGDECLSVTTVVLPEEEIVHAEDIPLDIVYEDAFILIINKPKGMVVHPAAGNRHGTLVSALLHHCGTALSHVGGENRPGIVHRLDKDTSGLLVVAKDDKSHQKLAQQFAEHSVHRFYHAIVHGGFLENEGEVDAPIGRSKNDRKKMAVSHENAKNAITRYRVLARYTGFTHLELKLLTGRTHQIRVHMANIHHPVAGDILYGPRRSADASLQGQCLHAKSIGLVHPQTGKLMLFESELPPYFTKFITKLER